MHRFINQKQGVGNCIAIFLVFIIIPSAHIISAEEGFLEVYNRNDRLVGKVDLNGEIQNRVGKLIGSVGSDGLVLNRLEKRVGHVNAKGAIYNVAGKNVGMIDSKGDVFNQSGKKVGHAEVNETLVLSGGAALVLFFQP